jgi:hypothetical protein
MKFGKRTVVAAVRRPAALLLGIVSAAGVLALTAGPVPQAHAAGPCYNGGYFFGIAPGSSARGGVSNLWLQANSSGTVTVAPGNGSAGQQWCEIGADVDSVPGFNLATYGNFGFGTKWYCLDDLGNPAAGQRMWVEPCHWESDGDTVFNQEWKVVLENSNPSSFSFTPAWPSSSGTVWLDIWGGPGTSAFKSGNPAQLWAGNGGDNQAYTPYVSDTGHTQPRGLSFDWSA